MNKKLTVIIPCLNEEPYIRMVLENISKAILPENMEKEILVVDDGSTDRTADEIKAFVENQQHIKCTYLKHETNKGKGASVQTALSHTTGQYIIIQDADFEYDPSEYTKLLLPILQGHADVVYGSRFRGSEAHRVLFFFHTAGNKLLTFFSNILTGLNLTDMETGYKLFRTELLKQIQLKEKRFGFEPEVTAKISRIKGVRIYEVGISYYGRSYEEGKKIKWQDGIKAFYCIIKYNLFSRK